MMAAVWRLVFHFTSSHLIKVPLINWGSWQRMLWTEGYTAANGFIASPYFSRGRTVVALNEFGRVTGRVVLAEVFTEGTRWWTGEKKGRGIFPHWHVFCRHLVCLEGAASRIEGNGWLVASCCPWIILKAAQRIGRYGLRFPLSVPQQIKRDKTRRQFVISSRLCIVALVQT